MLVEHGSRHRRYVAGRATFTLQQIISLWRERLIAIFGHTRTSSADETIWIQIQQNDEGTLDIPHLSSLALETSTMRKRNKKYTEWSASDEKQPIKSHTPDSLLSPLLSPRVGKGDDDHSQLTVAMGVIFRHVVRRGGPKSPCAHAIAARVEPHERAPVQACTGCISPRHVCFVRAWPLGNGDDAAAVCHSHLGLQKREKSAVAQQCTI